MVRTKDICKVTLTVVMIMMLLSCVSAQRVHAVSETGRSNKTLMSGVTESTVYVTDSGKQNIRAHILRVQKGANITFKTGYKGYFTKESTASSRSSAASSFTKKWKWSKVADHAKEYEATKDKAGTVIAAMSADFLGSNGSPYGTLVMEGHVFYNSPRPYFAQLKNGTYTVKAAGSNISDVQEGIGGDEILVKNGATAVAKNTTHDPSVREPRQAIGVTAAQEIVIVNVDGRVPASSGATLYTLAEIMKAQGCVEAINLDGGGSATFMTKRSGDSALKIRNTLGDGFVRNIASSVLIVKNSANKGGTLSGSATVSMKNSSTGLTKSSKGVYSYTINGRKQSGLYMINGKNYLFSSKGTGLSKTIKVGANKYTFKKGILKKSNDKKAGTVQMGRCGAGSGNSNLLFAFHRGDKVLNIGLNPLVKKNGKMKNFNSIGTNSPWYADRSTIKKINVGNGVTTLAPRFMYISRETKVFDGSVTPNSHLKTVKLPASLKTIGARAFYNTKVLKSLTIPAKVSKIGSEALKYTNAKTITFTGKKPPKIGAKALKGAKTKKIYVKKTSKWKKFVKAKKFKKVGYKKTVKYR